MAKRRSGTVITMEARLVEAAGAPWSGWGDPLSSPDVALDELSSLDPRYGPTVVRVSVSGPKSAARSLAGEWLCDPGVPNARIVTIDGAWNYTRASELAFEDSRRSELVTWEREDAPSLMYAAAHRPPLTSKCVAAAVACAESSYRMLRRRAAVVARRALDAASSGAPDGLALVDLSMQLDGMAREIEGRDADHSDRVEAEVSAIRACAWAAAVAADGGPMTPWQVASAARNAVRAIYLGDPSMTDMKAAYDLVGGIVRGHISTLDYLRAAARSTAMVGT